MAHNQTQPEKDQNGFPIGVDPTTLFNAVDDNRKRIESHVGQFGLLLSFILLTVWVGRDMGTGITCLTSVLETPVLFQFRPLDLSVKFAEDGAPRSARELNGLITRAIGDLADSGVFTIISREAGAEFHDETFKIHFHPERLMELTQTEA